MLCPNNFWTWSLDEIIIVKIGDLKELGTKHIKKNPIHEKKTKIRSKKTY